MIPYGRQSIGKRDIDAVLKTLKSDFITQGPRVLDFEKRLARYCSAKYAVAASSGTSALHLAYLASGIGEGDEVITTPNTFVATTNMLLAVGASPVFCDIRLDTYNIDESKIEKLITKRTKAIVPVHFAGYPCDMDMILSVARKHKLLVIEDGCHALGAAYKNKKIGSIGDMTTFSFHPVKQITTGEGGAVLTNDRNFYEKLSLLRSHGVKKDKNGFNVMTALGYNYRLTDIQSALGLSQLEKLNEFLTKRRQIVTWYKRELGSLKEIILPVELKNNRSAWHIFVIRTKKLEERNELAKYLKNRGVGVNFHYPAVYAHPYYRKNGCAKTKLPNEEKYHGTCLTLPLYPGLKQKEVKYISDQVKNFYHAH